MGGGSGGSGDLPERPHSGNNKTRFGPGVLPSPWPLCLRESSGFGGWESGTSCGPRADGSPFADHRASQAALLSPREPGAHCRPSSIREAGTQAACRTWSGPLKGLSRAGLRLPKQAPHQSRFLKFFYGPFQGLCVDSVDVACRQAPPPTLEGHFLPLPVICTQVKRIWMEALPFGHKEPWGPRL